jgi:hypothetical protein
MKRDEIGKTAILSLARLPFTLERRRSKSRGFKFLDEIVDSIARRSGRKEFLHLNFQHFGEIEQRFVVDVREPRFDLRDAASAYVKACDLQLRGKHGLRPAQSVATPPHLRANVVFIVHVNLLLGARWFSSPQFQS